MSHSGSWRKNRHDFHWPQSGDQRQKIPFMASSFILLRNFSRFRCSSSRLRLRFKASVCFRRRCSLFFCAKRWRRFCAMERASFANRLPHLTSKIFSFATMSSLAPFRDVFLSCMAICCRSHLAKRKLRLFFRMAFGWCWLPSSPAMCLRSRRSKCFVVTVLHPLGLWRFWSSRAMWRRSHSWRCCWRFTTLDLWLGSWCLTLNHFQPHSEKKDVWKIEDQISPRN